MNSNGTKLEQVVHTAHQKSCLSGWSKGFGELDPSPQWIPVLAPIYPLPLHGPNIRSEYTTFHFRDRRGAPSLCYKNRAKILVFANKRECCKLTCGISRQEKRSHMEVYRTYFK